MRIIITIIIIIWSTNYVITIVPNMLGRSCCWSRTKKKLSNIHIDGKSMSMCIVYVKWESFGWIKLWTNTHNKTRSDQLKTKQNGPKLKWINDFLGSLWIFFFNNNRQLSKQNINRKPLLCDMTTMIELCNKIDQFDNH